MTNRLSNATSPYLLQHQENPVHWWPWCDEAFDEAQRRDVPVFLSIGYSACHWCHVMAHESFEDEATARLLNENFVSIKVDREERPDVDAVYMSAVQGMTGRGGWPMTVFLDRERRPFHAGTYFPKAPGMGMPSFTQLLEAVSEAWTNRRSEVEDGASKISNAITEQADRLSATSGAKPNLRGRLAETTSVAIEQISKDFDPQHGGFGGAPKFPQPTVLEFLLRHGARANDPRALLMVEQTCEAMARGGLYDQLGGGFARYSVDAQWIVPHFEKMLYDNALLLRVYVHWYRQTSSPFAARIARETADFLLRDLLTTQGGFASALDADALVEPGGHAHEGVSYAWTPQQIFDVLGEEAGRNAAELFGVTLAGTFEEGSSVLQLLRDPDDVEFAESARTRLLAARDERPQPGRDDKVIAAWNGLAISALAEAGAILQAPQLIEAATRCAELLAGVHIKRGESGTRILRASRGGVGGEHAQGVLDDYALVADGFITLFGINGEQRWLDLAGELLDTTLAQFAKPGGGFFDTPADGETLIMRPSDPTDQVVPSGWAAAAQALLSYGTLMTYEPHLSAAAEALEITDMLGRRSPRFAGALLSAAEALIDGPREIIIVGDRSDTHFQELQQVALHGNRPGTVVAPGEPAAPNDPGPFAGRVTLRGSATAYVCVNSECKLPVTNADDLRALLAQ